MKVIFLNTWNGKQKTAIQNFLRDHMETTDIFCFQEAYDDMRAIAQNLLVDFDEYYGYAFGFDDSSGTEDFAQATYVRKKVAVIETKEVVDKNHVRGLGLLSSVNFQGKEVHILNYHGVSMPKHKLDTPDRLKQSADLASYFHSFNTPLILGGDFNFLPETNSYLQIKDIINRELVIDSKIKTTRNRLYWDRRPQKHLYSDYIFASNDVVVNGLIVPEIEVSDHLPLILDVSF